MTSTFHGLEVAKRGMSTQQAALYTTGQNIANANTPGYSRQRVNFEQTEPYPAPSMNRPEIPGQMGTGVKAGSIQRVRENFLDLQYRDEQNKVGYWSARSDALTKMEDILKEPSDSGLAKTMDDFWKGLQTLSTNPENSG
ncbi:flagellar basal body protein, partial [Priestia koreensis]